MNTVLMMVMLLLVIFALASNMLWLAVAIGLMAGIISIYDNRAGPEKRMFYPPQELPPIGSNKGEQLLYTKFHGDWDGLEDNYYGYDLIGSKWGSGIGRGIGFLR